MREIVIPNGRSAFGHSIRVLVGGTDEVVVANRLAHLVLILVAVVEAFPVGVLYVGTWIEHKCECFFITSIVD